MSAKTRLWLQSDGGIDDDSKTVGSVTWCDWQANNTDTEYVRADLCTPTDERVRALVDAVARLGLRELVAGWNGEGKEKPYAPHPDRLKAKIETTCGVIYAIDAALRDMEGGEVMTPLYISMSDAPGVLP